MVFIDDKKYSCEACIKGHRSSSCKHTDRPLFEIKKKGRPVTQCEHCRELRKTRQVHVKCLCEGKPPTIEEKAEKSKKGQSKKELGTAAFPHGLPSSSDAAGAQLHSEHSSDSDQTSTRVQASGTCDCKEGQECHCFSLKHRPRRNPAGSDPGSSSYGQPHASKRRGSASTALRPVLPKPAASSDAAAFSEHSDTAGPGLRPHLPRSSHGSAFFSPYGRAYNEHFTLDTNPHEDIAVDSGAQSSQPALSLDPSAALSLSASYSSPLDFPDFSQWSATPGSTELAAAMCACGDGCACPGCVEHRGADAWFTQECANPNVCTTCFTCLTNPRPPPSAPTPPTTPLGMRPVHEMNSLEEWLGHIHTSSSDLGQDFTDMSAYLPPVTEQQVPMDLDLSLPPYCTGFCIPGQCTCAPGSGAVGEGDSLTFDADLGDLPLDFDPTASTFSLPNSLPDNARETRLSPYPASGGVEGSRRASSTSSLLPNVATESGIQSLMSRTLSPQTSRGQGASSPTPVGQRRSRWGQQRSGSFYEAATLFR